MDPDVAQLAREERLLEAAELASSRGDARSASALFERACDFKRAAEHAARADEWARALPLALDGKSEELAELALPKLIADVGRLRFGLDIRECAELVRWADMIDSAAFPSAEMAVTKAEPVLQLMTVVEHKGNDAYLATMVPRLLEQPLEAVATSKDVQDAYAPLAAQQQGFIDLVKQHAEVRGSVVLVDLSEAVIDVAAKFVTYALWPESAYSVLLSRSSSKCKLSIGYNPWAPIERKHNIAAICERHGGGGHPVVGAISLPAGDVERAKKLAREIAEELAT